MFRSFAFHFHSVAHCFVFFVACSFHSGLSAATTLDQRGRPTIASSQMIILIKKIFSGIVHWIQFNGCGAGTTVRSLISVCNLKAAFSHALFFHVIYFDSLFWRSKISRHCFRIGDKLSARKKTSRARGEGDWKECLQAMEMFNVRKFNAVVLCVLPMRMCLVVFLELPVLDGVSCKLRTAQMTFLSADG